jgi:phage terminase Nu1 subunit (DNA packaging protein)
MPNINDSYKEIDGKICVTTQELCDQLGISRNTLTEWEDKGCPKAARGWWPIWDLLKWRGMIGGGVRTESDVEGMELTQQKLHYEAEYKKHQNEKVAFENSIAKGEYIKKEDITAELQRFFIVLKRSMMGYSRKIATEVSAYVDTLTARRIEKMVTELTKDALGQLCIDGVYSPQKKKEKA